PRSVREVLAIWCGIGLAVAVWKRELAVPHGLVDLASNDQAPDSRFNGDPVAIPGAQRAEVSRIDQQRAIRIVAAPRRIAKDLISIEHAPLPGSQHERKLFRRTGGLGI